MPKFGDIDNKIVVRLKDKQLFLSVVSLPHAKLVCQMVRPALTLQMVQITSNSVPEQI